MMDSNSVMEVWNYLNKEYNNNKEFKNEIDELVRFYTSKLVVRANTEESKEIVIDIMSEIIFTQFFHGYHTMKTIIEQSQLEEEQIFYPEFWSIPKGTLLNEIGKVMVYQFDSDEWAYHDGLKDYNIKMINLFPDGEGYNLYRQAALETANYGAYKAVLESKNYKGVENKEEEGLLLGSIHDIHFFNPQVFIQPQYYSPEHEIWEVFQINNGKTNSLWLGTIHLSTITSQNDEEDNIVYLLNVSLSDSIRLDEKTRIIDYLYNKLPKEIKENIQLRVYHLSNIEVVHTQN